MTSLSLSLSPARSAVLPKIGLALGMVVLGDWLFYGRSPGISVALFLAALALCALATGPARLPLRDKTLAGAILAAALLPLMEDLGLISFLFGLLGAALFAVLVTGGFSRGTRAVLAALRGLLLLGAFQILPDLFRVRQEAWARSRAWLRVEALLGWAIPLFLCGVFAVLFAVANPLIDVWLGSLDPFSVIERINVGRVIAWGLLLCTAWPFVAMRLREPRIRESRPAAEPVAARAAPLLGETVILRSLVLFNLLFAVQTVLDGVYLWGGVSLPDGMTYAQYAHRGAYPLIVTALLAAGFVLAALRPGGTGERSPLIRGLVFLWIGQNVLLVVSSILRLELYVEVYSLTEMRVAAFIWMGLVGTGLVLIVLRILGGRSNTWLVRANLAVLAATLYACSFVNFPLMIANFNVDHSDEVSGKGESLDAYYLGQLGPHAVPAMDRFIALEGVAPDAPIASRRNCLARQHAERMADWRAWSFRDWRLQRYLAAHAAAKEPSAATPAPDGSR